MMVFFFSVYNENPETCVLKEGKYAQGVPGKVPAMHIWQVSP